MRFTVRVLLGVVLVQMGRRGNGGFGVGVKAQIAGLGQTTIQLIASLPECSLPCLSTALQNAGCVLAEQNCTCGTQHAAIAAAAIPCLVSNCTTAEIIRMLFFHFPNSSWLEVVEGREIVY